MLDKFDIIGSGIFAIKSENNPTLSVMSKLIESISKKKSVLTKKSEILAKV